MPISLLNTFLGLSASAYRPYKPAFLAQIVHLNFKHDTTTHCLILIITLTLYIAVSYRIYIAILKNLLYCHIIYQRYSRRPWTILERIIAAVAALGPLSLCIERGMTEYLMMRMIPVRMSASTVVSTTVHGTAQFQRTNINPHASQVCFYLQQQPMLFPHFELPQSFQRAETFPSIVPCFPLQLDYQGQGCPMRRRISDGGRCRIGMMQLHAGQ
jgi:hypothetical protein